MSPARAYGLAALILTFAGAIILTVGAALLVHPALAPAGDGPNAGGVRIAGAVLALAALVKLALGLVLRRAAHKKKTTERW